MTPSRPAILSLSQNNNRLQHAGLAELQLQLISHHPAAVSVARNALGEPVSKGAQISKSLKETAEYVVEAYGKALVELAPTGPKYRVQYWMPIWRPTGDA